jgi:hypothetical protein
MPRNKPTVWFASAKGENLDRFEAHRTGRTEIIMSAPRVEAYMRASCSVLDFDVAELWIATKEEGRFHCVQLYTMTCCWLQNK